ncbi:RNA polymerase sigma factor [uncultured Eudoraea sp.]|uniref:RNA polymerase sigma factor n=1 Tax=uncultured Eudoraea sp. TaxID=1035614 RepID=UPI0026091A60|nr:RNA polymerase sigma factor [uncultured Eudoraea sp.]
MTGLTDEHLMTNIKNGDTKSLGVLYERYKNILFTFFIRTIQDYNASNDLLMETFERIYKYRSSYSATKKARPWIFQIASNLSKDYYKKWGKRQSIDKLKQEIIMIQPELPDETKSRDKLLHAALNKLKPPQRNIINMYYLLEMTYEDIAANENISINNARIKVCRALKNLKELLKDSEL